MRLAFFAACLVCANAFAAALAQADNPPADKPESSTGRAQTPETKGQKQPQGWTGPTNTGVGGAPASSPQGQTPPGMQSAPEGSSKAIVGRIRTKRTNSAQTARLGAGQRSAGSIHAHATAIVGTVWII